jgi:tetratricopeptide (TPR) repeat protein
LSSPAAYAEQQNRLGIALAQQGKLDEAIALYQRALAMEPQSSVTHFNLGNAQRQQGRFAEAAEHFREVLRLKPRDAETHRCLGLVAVKEGKLDDAVAWFRRALELQPDAIKTYNNLGVTLVQLGKLDDAIACFRQAVDRSPADAASQQNLGLALAQRASRTGTPPDAAPANGEPPSDQAIALTRQANGLAEQGQLTEAVALYREVLRRHQDYAPAHTNLGIALTQLQKYDEAVVCLRESLRLQPRASEAYNSLGIVLAKQGRFDEAIASYQHALNIQPESPGVYANWGNVLRDLGQLEEAHELYEKSLRLKPNAFDTHNNLGIVQAKQRRISESLASYDASLRLVPDYAEAHLNRAHALLMVGRFREGWEEYVWRWKCKGSWSPPFQRPPWDGSPLNGRTLLLHWEQGFGDTLQFVRYAPLIKQRGGHVVMVCQRALFRLLASCPGIDERVLDGTPWPEHDVYATAMSLPRLFGTTVETIPAPVPYLRADPQLVAQWRSQLPSQPGFKIGIAWQGNPKYGWDRHRSTGAAQFAALAALPGVHLVSLQRGPGLEQLSQLTDRFGVTELGSRVQDMADTAAILANLDLVVTVDSAMAHLAGALGVPVWVALGYSADWRWLLDREDSPWYPTVRLFRQRRFGDWPEVFDRVAQAVQKMLVPPTPVPQVGVPLSPGELIDRITILQLQGEHDAATAAQGALREQLRTLQTIREQAWPWSPELARQTGELQAVNARLWQLKDALRGYEERGDWGASFVELARSCSHYRARRAVIKQRIQELLSFTQGGCLHNGVNGTKGANNLPDAPLPGEPSGPPAR